ncbi:putative lipoprotein [Candidatus Terasakiella magnetica]|nr:putative lipoprotein [Candidatus Terasakiella magnetica]
MVRESRGVGLLRNGLAGIALVGMLAGCSNGAPGSLDASEKALELGGGAQTFHWVLHDPQGIKLHFPGYLIGIEKSPQSLIGGPGSVAGNSSAAAAVLDNWQNEAKGDGDAAKPFIAALDRVRQQSKVLYPTHVIRYSADESGRIKSAPLYSALSPDETPAKTPGDQFQSDVTHVFISSMGWNTDQLEAVRNFNALFGHVLDQAESARKNGATQNFRPLFIGMTWSSKWPGWQHDLDYFNKANDADEYGAVWIRRVIHDVVGPALSAKADRPKVIVVGHSFGARAVAQGVISPGAPKVVDLLLLLQPAFSKNRFVEGEGLEKAPYRKFADHVGKVVMIASNTDSANSMAFWSEHAGDGDAWAEACVNANGRDKTTFDCTEISADGVMTRNKPSAGDRVPTWMPARPFI